MGCFRLLCLKNPQHQQNNTQKTPEHNTAPTKPQCSLFQQFQLSGVFVSASCIHRKAASDRKNYRLCGQTLGTGAAAALQPGWVSITDNIAPPSNHQHSQDCSGKGGILLPLHHYQDTLQICSLGQKLQPGKPEPATPSI